MRTECRSGGRRIGASREAQAGSTAPLAPVILQAEPAGHPDLKNR